jgi:hypothetical protein
MRAGQRLRRGGAEADAPENALEGKGCTSIGIAIAIHSMEARAGRV